MIFRYFLMSFLFASASQANSNFIVTQNGYEINGFGATGLKNSEYKRVDKGDVKNMQSYSNGDSRNLDILTSENQKHVLLTDKSLSGIPVITSTIFENGVLKSQLNCLNNELHGKCYAVTKEVCQAVLKQSGKKTFSDFEKEIVSCQKTMNIYAKAIDDKKIQSNIDQAYAEHRKILTVKYPISSGIHAFGENLGNVFDMFVHPEKERLDSAGSVEQSTDYRIYGMINTCRNYMERSSFSQDTPVLKIETHGAAK